MSLADFELTSPFASPSQRKEDKRLAERLGKLSVDSGRTRSQIEALDVDRKSFRGLADRFALESANIEPERRALRGAAGSAAAQSLQRDSGVTAGSTLDKALRTAKVRQGIINRGDSAIRNQRLKDRLAIVRAGISRSGASIDLQGAGQQIRAGVNLAGQQARDAIAAARSGAAGAAVGAGAAYFKNRNQSTPAEKKASSQQQSSFGVG